MRYVAGRLGCEGWDRCRAIGVEKGGRIVGGVVFHDWWPEKGVVEITAAGDRGWFDFRLMRAVRDYAFSYARLVVARTSERNDQARAVWRALGGAEVRVPDLWAEGEAGMILTMTKEACR